MVERCGMQRSSFLNNDMPIHKSIPMEKLDFIESNQVKLLCYHTPRRFCVYLRQKIDIHAKFQIELQRTMQSYQSISSPTSNYERYQAIAAQDNHAVWHRAIILDIHLNSTKVRVYFVDFGEEENISMTNIRPLPQEFARQPAFAIPCRLYDTCPLYGNEQSIWNSDDPVHEEFSRHMTNMVHCKVCEVVDHTCYDVQIDVPDVGDLGIFLWNKKLVSRITMQTSQTNMYNTNPSPQQQSFGRIPPGYSGLPPPIQQLQSQRLTPQNDYYNSSNNPTQQVQTHSIQKPIVQQSSSASTFIDSSSDTRSLPLQDGHYIITQVYSAVEFYGCSHGREKELNALQNHFEEMFNSSNVNDQSLSVHLLMEGTLCVIQQGDKYHRVVIKHRESESRVSVKLIDRGDELIVDTSELLQLEKNCATIPVFAQPFRLFNYDESNSSAQITRNLKRLILKQRVQITQRAQPINGFYPVEVRLSDGRLVNQIPLANNNIILPQTQPVEKVEKEINLSRTNDDLPAPQKLLTVAPIGRSQPGRFTPNQPTINDPTSRFPRPQNQDELSSRPINGNQQTKMETNRPINRGFDNDEQRNGNNRGDRNDFSDRYFNRNKDEHEIENIGQRPPGFGNRGGGSNNVGFADRGNRSGFNDRQNFENRNENHGQRSGGFNSRGGFGERGTRGGGFQDRNNDNRNNYNENSNDNNNNNNQRSYGFASRGGFNGERGNRTGGFQNSRERRDDRGGFRGGRGNRSGRGARSGGFNDQNDDDFRPNTENNEPVKAFSGWSSLRSALKSFEAGDHFTEKEVPKDTFQFVLSHIETLTDFFIQLFSKCEELSQLTEQLQAEYKDAPELTFSSIKTNQVCLAKSSDLCWYRASVLSVNSAHIQVRFIDFGDTMNVDAQSIRQLASKFCLKPPYAYRCTIRNIEGIENLSKDKIILKCTDKRFSGKFEKQLVDEKYLLQSDDFEKTIFENKLPKSSVEKRIQCPISHIDEDNHQFYIQIDDAIMDQICDQVTAANESVGDNIEINSMVIATYIEAPYRAIIQEDLGDNVKVLFIDYGNAEICPKNSLKKCHEQLKSYAPQAKRCELSDIPENELGQALTQLKEYIESEKTEISCDNQNVEPWHVRVYIDGECFNQKFPSQSVVVEKNDTSFDMDDQSSTTTTTTVQEQERPTGTTWKRNNEEILSPGTDSSRTSMAHKRQKSESENEINFKKYNLGILTHSDEDKPIVYMQLLPESTAILDRINDLIKTVIEENQHNSSYEIGDYCIAQYSADEEYYRARIESYSSDKQNYTVYFLDYGNLDKNVPLDHLFICTNELKEIECLAQKYTLENQTTQTWTDLVRPCLESKINDEFEYYFTDQIKSIIHIKFDNDKQMYVQAKTFTANISGINKDCFYIHILPDVEASICEMDEELHNASKVHLTTDSWQINDRCIVLNNENEQHFRGKILAINNDKYDVQCIDFGNILFDRSKDDLFVLNNEEFFQQAPLAHQCRLYGVNEENQVKAIEEIIKNISATERVTITTNNDQNDPCMYVMLFREDHEIVNDRYQSNNDNQQQTEVEKKTIVLPNASDSAIAADVDTSANETLLTSTDQHLTSPIGAPQADSTHQYGDTTDVIVGNRQSIDFGENDPSTSNTTIKDDGDGDNDN
ncbi:hypothetical protein I4U23_012841 [Adineta vaga]|nr:hypothetical protein I4U23_012841 [Adineta vaga]